MTINRRVTQQDLSWFLDLSKQKTLNLEPPYQRKSVWTSNDKRFFLNTVLNNYPCPAIYLQKETNEHFVTTYNVVDGKQRLMTVIDFYNDKLKLPDDFGDERLNSKKWSQIADVEIKKAFLNYSFTVETLDALVDYNKWNDVFDRLNRNSKTLSNQELRHARYNGWLINRAEQEVLDPIWKTVKIASVAKARRMKDVEFVSILMLVVLENKIVGFPQSALDSLYEKYETFKDKVSEEEFFEGESFNPVNDSNPSSNDSKTESNLKFDEQVGCYEDVVDNEDEFEKRMTNIKQCINSISNYSNLISEDKFFGQKRTTHFYTLWTYLVLEGIPDNIQEFAIKLKSLFELLNRFSVMDENDWSQIDTRDPKDITAIKYLKNSIGPTTEKPQRQARLEALSEFIKL